MIVKASSGPRYVVGCRSKVDKEKLTAGTRVVLDMTTLTIMRALPREVSYYDLLFTSYLKLDREKTSSTIDFSCNYEIKSCELRLNDL